MLTKENLMTDEGIVELNRLLDEALNANRFGQVKQDNKAGSFASVYIVYTTSGGLDTVSHKLGRIPEGFIPISKDGNVTVWKDSTAWTQDKVYLQSNSAGKEIKLMLI